MYVSAPGDPSPPSASNFIPELPRKRYANFLVLDAKARGCFAPRPQALSLSYRMVIFLTETWEDSQTKKE